MILQSGHGQEDLPRAGRSVAGILRSQGANSSPGFTLCSSKTCLNSSGVNVCHQVASLAASFPGWGPSNKPTLFLPAPQPPPRTGAEGGEHRLCSAQGLSVFHQAPGHHSQLAVTLGARVPGGLSAPGCFLKQGSLTEQLLPTLPLALPLSCQLIAQVHSIQHQHGTNPFYQEGGARLQVMCQSVPHIHRLHICECNQPRGRNTLEK